MTHRVNHLFDSAARWGRGAKLLHGPVGGVALGHVSGLAWLTSRLVRLTDSIRSRVATVMRQLQFRTGTPNPGCAGKAVALGEAALKDSHELAGDGQFQGLAGLGVLDPESHPVQVGVAVNSAQSISHRSKA